jgi:hypothetical protein
MLLALATFAACHSAADATRADSRNNESDSTAFPTHLPQDARSASAVDEDGEALPVFMIDVRGAQIASNGETPGVLKVIEHHDGSLKNLASRPASLESAVSLELHGDTSAGLAKKSYRLELVDRNQKDHDLPLLGLPAGSDWVLHSCGYDPICLRNSLVYALAQQFGHYAPRTRFVELVLDNEYQGLYVLIERVRRDRNRVNLPRPSARGAEGDITGGYIFKTDLGEGNPGDRVSRDWVSSVSQTVYSYYYPRFDAITAAQKAYLQDHVSRFEAVMRGPGWNDARTGYRQWIDVPSWVDFALLQELSMNPDAYFKSVYLQKWPRAMGDKIAVGPLWDFDLAFGVAEFRDARNTQGWAHTMNRFGGERVLYDPPGKIPYVPEYWERLWTDEAFQRDLKCRWQELRNGPLRDDALNGMIDGWLDELSVALPRDAARWSELPKNAYSGGEESLKNFLGKRLAWMDANLPGTCTVARR